MKCKILHETTGRLRVHLCCGRMTVSQADVLEYYLRAQDGVQEVRVYDRTQDAVVLYEAERGSILRALAVFSFAEAEAMELVPEHTSRALNREFEDKLAVAVMRRCISKLFLPAPITTALALLRSVKYIREGLSALWHGKLSVAVLDATAVTVSMARGDFATAGSVMFMLHLGEILEEWTHKKSVADLASAMSLRVDSVWQQVNGTEVLTKITDVKPGDRIVIRTGGMIPLDGRVVEGEAMVNQSSLTGESMPVAKHPGSPVYAGTVAEEGECVISVEKSSGSGRYDRVVRMIEESEKLKSTAEDKASRMADRLVPYTLGGTALTYLLTRNVTKMLSVLMVDFSCALKLAIPIAVLSAMRESSGYHISVKGGRFLEAVAKADTIVFDKTGTLTYATPTVAQIVPFGGHREADMLRLAACLEEHYPHSMANAVVEEAKLRGLSHEEYHSQVQYVVAHGISSMVEGKKVLIGSAHFVFEDEGCTIPFIARYRKERTGNLNEVQITRISELNAQLKELEREVEIALNVGRVHDVDDAVRLLVEDKVTGDDLLLCIGPQGVDAGQIHHGAAFFVYDLSHLLVYRDTGKVADMLIGAGEGVEESRFAAVLISDECKDHFSSPSTSIF